MLAPAPLASVEGFLIEFVVDQTGYPPAVVRWMPIWKPISASTASEQLFGELREHFELPARGSFRLTDFPTLRHISRFLTEHCTATRTVEQPSSNGSALAPPEREALEGVAAPSSSVATAKLTERWQQTLIDFVIEQTGYPPAVVSLDADLEADLGIDSIKKAQLFGELHEQFSLTRRPGLKLSDFPTLRHILDFMQQQLPGNAAGQSYVAASKASPNAGAATINSSPAGAAKATRRDAGVSVRPVVTPAADVSARASQPSIVPLGESWTVPTAAAPSLRIMQLSGTPYEMGYQQGKHFGDDIREFLESIAQLPAEQTASWGCELRDPTDAARYLDADELEELRGVANGAGLHWGNVLAHNLSFAPEFAVGCTHFAVTARSNGGEMIHAVNEDAPLALHLPRGFARIVQVRRPSPGVPHVMFSAAGHIGGFNGINSAGIAISSTLLLNRAQASPEPPVRCMRRWCEACSPLRTTSTKRLPACVWLGGWARGACASATIPPIGFATSNTRGTGFRSTSSDSACWRPITARRGAPAAKFPRIRRTDWLD